MIINQSINQSLVVSALSKNPDFSVGRVSNTGILGLTADILNDLNIYMSDNDSRSQLYSICTILFA